MPPLRDPHTLHRIQQHLGSAVIGSFPPSLERRVLEEQTNPVVAHVCADVDSELKGKQNETGWIRPFFHRRVHRQASCTGGLGSAKKSRKYQFESSQNALDTDNEIFFLKLIGY